MSREKMVRYGVGGAACVVAIIIGNIVLGPTGIVGGALMGALIGAPVGGVAWAVARWVGDEIQDRRKYKREMGGKENAD